MRACILKSDQGRASHGHLGKNRFSRHAGAPPRLEPRTIDYSDVSLDVLGTLLSFHARTVGLALNKSYDHEIAEVSLARGTGKVSVLLLTAANPGIRPSVIAHFIHKDRAAMARLIEQMKANGLIEHKVDADERRAHELYLTPKGDEPARAGAGDRARPVGALLRRAFPDRAGRAPAHADEALRGACGSPADDRATDLTAAMGVRP